ncbi:MAG: flagellar basal body rod C-terminal domain-containing protein, partial [Planctomycetota bacterium]
YRRRVAHFAPGDPSAGTKGGRRMGVHVREIEAVEDALRRRFDPSNPYADERGYVMVPDINTTTEQINAMQASRAYEANVAAAEAQKSMLGQGLRLLA